MTRYRAPVLKSAGRALLVLVIGFVIFGLLACGGSGGKDDDDDEIDEGGGVGIGDDGVTIFWQQYESEEYPGLGRAYDFARTAERGFVLTGFASRAWGEPGHVFLVKTDSSGNLQWRRVFEDATASSVGNVVVEATNGGYVVGGFRESGEHPWFYLLRTDANGNVLAGWPKDYGIAGWGLEGRGGIADLYETDSGFVWVGQSEFEYLIAKVDHDGELVWGPHRYSGPPGNVGPDIATSIDANGDGFVVAGMDGGPNTLVGVFKTDSEGKLREGWPRTYGEGAALSVRSTGDGGFVIAGKAGRFPWPGGADALLIRVDDQGNESWRKTFGGARNDELRAVDVLSDGSIIAVGETNSYSSGFPDMLMVKVSDSGETHWQKVIGRGPSHYDIATSVQAHPDGSFVLAGEAGGRPVLAKMDRNGNTVSLGDLENKITIPSVTGTINFNNGALVAGRGAEAPLLMRQFAAFGLDQLLIEQPTPAELCTGGGTYVPVQGPVTLLGEYFIPFDNCVLDGADALTLSGSLSVRVGAISGTLEEGGVYQVQLTYYDIDLVTADDVGETRFWGRLRYNRNASGNSFTEIVDFAPTPFIIVEGTTRQTLKSGSLGYQLNGNAFTVTSDDGVVFELSGVDGDLDLAITEPVSGRAFPEPEDGRIKITADDGSSAVVILTVDAVVIEIDTVGDGVVDGVLRTTWDDLI